MIDALLTLVAERGFAATSMDEVAERAGVSKATIYRRWPSREALVLDAHRAMLSEADVPDTGTLEGDLVALLERVADVMEDPRIPRVMQASAGEILANPELAPVFRQNLMEPRLALVRQVFERAAARGEIAGTEDWREMAYSLIGPNILRVAFMGEPPDRAANRRLAAMIAREVHEAAAIQEPGSG